MKNNRTFLEKLLDGVEVQYEKLSDVLPIKRGKRVVRNELDENGIYPVYQNSLQPLGISIIKIVKPIQHLLSPLEQLEKSDLVKLNFGLLMIATTLNALKRF